MRLTRVFVPEPLADRTALRLPEGAGSHLSRVLRLEVGAPLVLFDGNGGEYPATICAIERRGVDVEIGPRRDIERESPLAVTLLQGLSRGERMDLIVQKATELGVACIWPIFTQRSSIRLDAEQSDRKLSHWQAIATSACEQSGRNRLPRILPPAPLEDACRALQADLKLVLCVDGSQPLPRLLRESARLAHVGLLVGPEGGLDDAEEQLAQGCGFRSALLGPRVLRTETAPLAALAALQTLAGDFCV
jgi:16S rRNA (uracil1498-N3)-methyltransferase